MTQEEFFDRYTYDVVEDRIGGGGFGTVYKAYDNVLHHEVAIKVSEVKKTANGKVLSLKDEIEALSGLPDHPNIANYEKDKLFTFKTPQGVFDYAVMQYYPDGNLSNAIAIKPGLTDEQKEDIALQLLEGIGFLHKHKVVHRDLKPSNILIVKHEGRIIPLITDFGLSKATGMGENSVFSNSFGGGTPRYSSPEQLQGKPLRLNTDLWSYGAILYELFTGEQLFSAGSGAANTAQADLEIYNKIVNGDVRSLKGMPEKWRKVAERCLVVDPTQRAKDAAELFAIIKGDETEVGGSGGGTPPPEPEPNPNPKKGLWIGLGIAALVALLSLILWPKKPQPTDPDTQAFEACETVEDYRAYCANYGLQAIHYDEAQHLIDSIVADSTQCAKAEAQALAIQEEENAYQLCTTIEGCDAYLEKYPQGSHLEEVQAKRDELAPKTGSFNGHEWVDLGLPSGTLWATCNIGASSPEGYGNYYAWGETSTKSTYNWDTYKYANGAYDKLTKYCDKSNYGNNGFTDNLTTLQAGDDPATAKWGSGWHTPGKTQWDELLNNTTRKWTTQNGKAGYLFTSKKNGQSVFLPAAGYRWFSELYYTVFHGYYWSRSLVTDYPRYAWYLYFTSGDCGVSGNYRYRYYGFSVRPVREK